MSKAEELAEELIQIIDGPAFHVPHYKVRDVVDELRRLAALEEELNALKSAIMDAEPAHFRAILVDDQKAHQIKTSMHVVGIREKQAADAFIEEQRTFYGWNYTLEPLYTLNGIKK